MYKNLYEESKKELPLATVEERDGEQPEGINLRKW